MLFAQPIRATLDATGFLYVIHAAINTVSKLDALGAPIATYIGFAYPTGLAFEDIGNLLVANQISNTLCKVNGGGDILATYTRLNHLVGLAFDGTGDLYVANFIVNKNNAAVDRPVKRKFLGCSFYYK